MFCLFRSLDVWLFICKSTHLCFSRQLGLCYLYEVLLHSPLLTCNSFIVLFSLLTFKSLCNLILRYQHKLSEAKKFSCFPNFLSLKNTFIINNTFTVFYILVYSELICGHYILLIYQPQLQYFNYLRFKIQSNDREE